MFVTSPLIHSLIVAFFSTGLSFILTLPLSYLAIFHSYKGQRMIETLLLLPLVLPPTIVGLYLLKLFGKYGFIGSILERWNFSFIFTLSGAILATTIILIPITYQGLKGALASVPISYIEAAFTLSATPLETLFKITLPNCWSSVAATLLLSFSRGLGEFGASLMVAGYIEGKTDTMSTAIYFAVQEGNWQRANQLSLVMIVLGLMTLLLIHYFTPKKEKIVWN